MDEGVKHTTFVEKMIAWGREYRRDFPWRNERDAFRILIAEILLQRSRAKTVSKIYHELFDKWPTAESLAEAPLAELEDTIRPLGLVRRAATLKALAQDIKKLHKGVPNSMSELMGLPGVGRYIAAATVATAFDSPEPLVDSVTGRVYRRFFGLASGKSHKSESSNPDRRLWDLVSGIIPEQRAHELNWAVLDLSASVCIPKRPRCEACPLKEHCEYVSVKR